MIKAIFTDLTWTILLPKDKGYKGSLNHFHDIHAQDPNYLFWDYYDINQEYLEILKKYKDQYRIYMFTAGDIQNTFELKSVLHGCFLGIFSPETIGYRKDSVKAYVKLAKMLGLKPEEILYIDNEDNFLNTAREVGWNVLKYTDNEKLKIDLTTLL